MEGQRPVIPERPGVTVEAWQCEHCRKFYPNDHEAKVVVVDVPGSGRSLVGGVESRGRIARRVVVCTTCRRTITGKGA